MSEKLLPRYAFFIAGSGRHADRLQAFDRALLDAGPVAHNLVTVSSILPAGCAIIPAEKGFNMLTPGQITFCIMARQDTDQPGETASASVGLARVKDQGKIGYISEYHGNAPRIHEAEDIAKKLAAEMLAVKFAISTEELNPELIQATAASIKQSGGSEWVCAVALCIFIIDEH